MSEHQPGITEPSLLKVRLTGEPVTIVARSSVCLALPQPLDLRSVLHKLAAEVHPWFGLVAAGDGAVADLGQVLLLLDGKRLDLPRDAQQVIRGGELYIIPPIPGG